MSVIRSLPAIIGVCALGPGCADPIKDTGTETIVSSACADETRDEPYTAGMISPTDDPAFSVRLIDIDPAPAEKGKNTWRLEIIDTDEVTVPDTDVAVEPFMPDHGHGTNPPQFESNGAETDGTLIVPDIHFIMSGYWEISVHVTVSDTAVGTALYRFCVDS